MHLREGEEKSLLSWNLARKLLQQCFWMSSLNICNVPLTTKAAASVLKCKWKPTRQSLLLESCQCLRHLPINRTPAVFCAAGVYFSQQIFLFFCSSHHTVPPENDVCVPACMCLYLIEVVNDKLAASQRTWSLAGGTTPGECADAQQAQKKKKGAAKQMPGDEGTCMTAASDWDYVWRFVCKLCCWLQKELWGWLTGSLMTDDIILDRLLHYPSKQIEFPP